MNVNRLALHLLLFILCFTSAGCISGSGDSPNPPTETRTSTNTSAPVPLEVTSFPVAIDAAAGNQSNPARPADVHLVEPDFFGSFQVESTAIAIVAEAQWTCQTPTCRFRLTVAEPTTSTSSADSFWSFGTGYARAQSPSDLDLAPGTWLAGLRADSASAGIVGEIRVSVFHDGTFVPDDYSAFATV